jgi:hypothetical protein
MKGRVGGKLFFQFFSNFFEQQKRDLIEPIRAGPRMNIH